MSTVTITTENGKTSVHSPYHPDWPSQARDLGGKWRGGAWVFDARDETRVRELARAVYGTDGSPDEDTVTVRLPAPHLTGEANRPVAWWAFGREIAARFSRDERVRLGDGVVIVSGGFERGGGSVKYPSLNPKDGTVVEVRDVPRALVAGEEDAEIVEEAGTSPDREALTAERAKLVARIAEIDAQLNA
ncbi:hypothetical protein [Streptomyces sp. NPDC088925]|uniref:hypothetical protein n=1 Tax=Streptomyces sp. NPDC088925 TaxID=3365914 RepID=UPI003800E942